MHHDFCNGGIYGLVTTLVYISGVGDPQYFLDAVWRVDTRSILGVMESIVILGAFGLLGMRRSIVCLSGIDFILVVNI